MTRETQAENSHVLDDLVEPLNRYFHIPVAGILVGPLRYSPVTPNQVTAVSVVFGLAAAYGFSLGTSPGLVLGGLLLEISLILDCVDGQLARAKNMASDLGRLIDGVGGCKGQGEVHGLGLSVSFMIFGGGKISAASKLGDGDVRVTLPLSEPTRLPGSIHHWWCCPATAFHCQWLMAVCGAEWFTIVH